MPPIFEFIAIRVTVDRLRAKKPTQLLRTVGLTIWPLAPIWRGYYRLRFSRHCLRTINRHAQRQFERQAPQLDEPQRNALDALHKDGIAITHIDRLLPDVAVNVAAIEHETQAIFARPEIAQQIDRRKSDFGANWYVVRGLGPSPPPIPKHIAHLILNDRLLDVINSYLGYWSRISFIDLWYNFPVGNEELGINAEKWHRDHEDVKNVTLFFYLGETDKDNGALQYLRETHVRGRFGQRFTLRPASACFISDDEVERALPPDQLVHCEGSTGTMVLCDTVGLHRGGRATRRQRLLLVARFVSDGGLDPMRYELQEDHPQAALSAPARYALRCDSATAKQTHSLAQAPQSTGAQQHRQRGGVKTEGQPLGKVEAGQQGELG